MPPASTAQDIDAQIQRIQASIAKRKKKLAGGNFKERGGKFRELQSKIRSQEERLNSLLGDRDLAGVEAIPDFALSEEQKSGLFGQARAATEASTRESLSDLSAKFGGDDSDPLFNFLSSTALAGGAAAGAGQRLRIETEESRRAQEIGLQKQQLTLGFRELGEGRKARQFNERLQTAQFRFQTFQAGAPERARALTARQQANDARFANTVGRQFRLNTTDRPQVAVASGGTPSFGI